MKQEMLIWRKLFVAVSLFVVAGASAVYFKQAAKAELIERTENSLIALENYDVRTDKNAVGLLADLRGGQTAAAFDAIRGNLEAGEKALHRRVPNLNIEAGERLNVPEIIGTNSPLGAGFLTAPQAGKRSEILRRFLRENDSLVGLTDEQINVLRVTADYTNPNGVLSFAHLEQFINGVPVFQAEVKAGFTQKGEIFRIVNNLAPALDYESISNNFGSVETAVFAAAKFIKREASAADVRQIAADDVKVTFERGQFAGETTAEKFYFPIEAGAARPAWRVLLWENLAAFYVIVDAETGALLWRKNIVENQTQPATYNFYNSDSATPNTPGATSPAGAMFPPLAVRVTRTFVGSEPPNQFNNLGWIPDNSNITRGNNVEAGLDRDTTNGVDANGHAVGNPNRVFSYVYNPAPGNPAPGDAPAGTTATPCVANAPAPTQFQQGAVTNLFYTVNRFHDETYKVGFTEQARNFQQSNFGRGGGESDDISAEAQDCSGVNTANFATPADGGRGRLQAFVFTATAPDVDRDGALDNQTMFHELAHGLSSRQHSNGSGLTSQMARAMGEGWSDFFALAVRERPSETGSSTFPFGTYNVPNNAASYYYGIRRFPYANKFSSFGAGGRPHNPLTFGHLNANCAASLATVGAYQPNPAVIGNCDSINNGGEIWASALWEMRGQLSVFNGSFTVANTLAMQYTIDGMKLAPINPTSFLQERDAMIAAIGASGNSLNLRAAWTAFAARGMGYSASVASTVSPVSVVEAFDTPNVTQTPALMVSDAPPLGNGNGFPESSETVTLTIPLNNSTGTAAANVVLTIVGGAAVGYDTIASGTTATRTLTYTIPRLACGTDHVINFTISSSLGTSTFTRTIRVGLPLVSLAQNFDAVTVPALPADWATAQTGTGVNWTTVSTLPDTLPNAAFVPNPATAGGADLTSPAVTPLSFGLPIYLTFRHSYDTDATWDGGVLEVSRNSGAYQDVFAAGGIVVENGYNGTLRGTGNPLANRNGWTGNSNGYVTTTIQLPFVVLSQNMRFRWRFGHDSADGGAGWRVDSVRLFTYACGDPAPRAQHADFDGDYKSDLSVFRGGNWYAQRSTSGFVGVNWGLGTDTPVAGDFDGDAKTDYGVFRPTSQSGVADFYLLKSNGNTFAAVEWGQTGDVPIIGDYDGDGRDDVGIFRGNEFTSNFHVLPSSGGLPISFAFGGLSKPVVGDFDGDFKDDSAIVAQGSVSLTWTIRKSASNTVQQVFWGLPTDKPVVGDYDGDGRDDIAVYRPSNGTWYIAKSSGGFTFFQFGIAADIPVPADYDGDGRDDIAVFRDGNWYIQRSSQGFTAVQFGIAGDKPVPSLYLP